MSFSYDTKDIDSPLVRTTWRIFSAVDTPYTSLPDSHWDVIVVRQNQESCLLLSGTTTKVRQIVFRAGVEYIGINFKPSVFLPQAPLATLLNTTRPLVRATGQTFWLHDTTLEPPDFETADLFVEKLKRSHLIVQDPLLKAVLAGEEPPVSRRSVQRHFVKKTGLTYKTIQQIERARTATECLEYGVSIQDTVHRLGYTDQPHLTKALKYFIGKTPAQIARAARQPVAFLQDNALAFSVNS
jgi:hypothetical protein